MNERPKLVLFTGAGASKPFGYPLTSELLPQIQKELRSGVLFEGFDGEKEWSARLKDLFRKILPKLRPADAEFTLITDILSLLDYSGLTATSPIRRGPRKELADLRNALELAIIAVLWRDPYTPTPGLLKNLADGLTSLALKHPGRIGVISTNYDVVIETAVLRQLKRRGISSIESKIDFGFDWRDPTQLLTTDVGFIHRRPVNPIVSLYKLHGALNWLRCSACEHTYISRSDLSHHAFSRKRQPWTSCHCGHWPLEPVLVAPSLIREVRDHNLLQIWKHSLELLRTASHWVIAGYSLPPEDVAIRSMMFRAYHHRKRKPQVTVVQRQRYARRQSDRALEARYRLLLPNCDFQTDGIEGFIETMM